MDPTPIHRLREVGKALLIACGLLACSYPLIVILLSCGEGQ